MQVTHIRSILNELTVHSRKSDTTIKGEDFFILHLEGETPVNPEVLASKIFNFDYAHHFTEFPSVVYVSGKNVMMVFKAKNPDDVHMFGGSQQKISTTVASFVSLKMKNIYCCTVAVSDSKMLICAYIIWAIFENIQNQIMKLSSEELTKRDLMTMTEAEIIDTLKKRGVDWCSVSGHDKYGTFIKKRQGELKFDLKSMHLTFLSIDKEMEFIF